jgi:hypothetical protein
MPIANTTTFDILNSSRPSLKTDCFQMGLKNPQIFMTEPTFDFGAADHYYCA